MLRRWIDRNLWIVPLGLATALACWGLCGSCSLLEQENWVHVERELELTVQDLDTLIQLAEDLEREDRVAQLRDVRAFVVDAEVILQAYNEGAAGRQGVWESLDGALAVLDKIADEEEQGDLKVGVALAKIAIRRLQARFDKTGSDKTTE